MQGYAGETGDNEWLTTAAGEIVSGSKQPRFHRESVYGALSTLFDRIAAINKDCKAGFKITEAVAFGDFLTGRANCQTADVGIELARREVDVCGDRGPGDFLKQLSGNAPRLRVRSQGRNPELFGGGGGYYGYRKWGTGGGVGIVGLVLIILLVSYLFGGLRQ